MKIEITNGQVIAISENREDVLTLISMSKKSEAPPATVNTAPETKRRGRPVLTPKQKRAHRLSKALKAYWAKKREESAGTPVAITKIED